MTDERAPTITDRIGVAAVFMLIAAFMLSSLVVLVPQAQADDKFAGKRDDGATELVGVDDDDDDDDDSGNTGNTGTATGTTRGTGPSNTNTWDTRTGTRTGGLDGNGTKTGTTQGTGPSNTNTNDTRTGTRTGNGGNSRTG